ncbi:hypothetical protein D3C75_1138440 [compost metagenome]
MQVSGQRIKRYLGLKHQFLSQVGQCLLLECLSKAREGLAQAMPALRHELGQLQVACAFGVVQIEQHSIELFFDQFERQAIGPTLTVVARKSGGFGGFCN